jgi:PAS domain S-box-containing protein/diguanylate cyclase (GGDEF)-like protein
MDDTQDLRVLMVEDSAADAELMLRELQRRMQRPIVHCRVASEQALVDAIDGFRPDVILSDFSMPSFGGEDALDTALRRAPGTPFLYVSGTIGEERAIEALQRGAWDYVLKENLRRLPTSVERALRVARERAERAQMQRALRTSEERFRSIVETSQDWIWEWDAGLLLTYSNDSVAAMLGYTPAELHGKPVLDLLVEEDLHEVQARLPALLREGRGWQRWRLRWVHRNGERKVLDSTGHPLFDDDGTLLGFRGVNHDVTERLRQDARIRQFARIHAVLSAVGNVVLRSSDRSQLLRNACRIAVEQGGFKAAGIGVRGADGALHVSSTYGDADVLAEVDPGVPMDLGDESVFRDHPSLVAFRGNRVVAVPDFRSSNAPLALRTQMLRNGVRSQISLPIGAEPWGLLALYSDVAREYDARELELLQRLADEIDYAVDFIAKGERLSYLAYHNPVTGLPNRAAFQRRVAELLAAGAVAIVALDVHRFGHINNSHGRDFGDALLAEIGRRLQARGAQAFVAHPEADTFLVAYPASGSIDAECERLAAWLHDIERDAVEVRGERLHVRLKAGIALGPGHGAQADVLERHAVAAMADASEKGLPLRAWDPAMGQRAARRVQMESDLRRALDEHQFELFYQPKFDAAGRHLIGAEALLRWHHPTDGLVSPADFIPVLEDTGLMVPVGQWVMREAVAMAQAWRSRFPDFRIAVNVSARELRHAEFLEGCRALLAPFAGTPPIDIEVTESLLVHDVDQSVRLLQGMRDLGCKVAIDDFGTGYSSLNYLVRLPIDTVKIDQSFVAMLGESPETVSLVTNMIGMAHTLGLDVVAEGVEQEAQAAQLRELDCDVLQGYLLGRPIPAERFQRELLSG